MAFNTDTTIPKNKQNSVLTSFWAMLTELETQADNDGNALLKHFVEGYFRQWNELCKDNKQPVWVCRAEGPQN